tara:strand:- start:835 stop:1287 length:453 start_codon:yes stop_codon:yes gene_type:complete
MSWLVALQAVGTGISIMSAMNKGEAKYTNAQFEASQYALQTGQNKIIAEQNSIDRLEKFDQSAKVNEAMFAFLGRDADLDESIQAFNKKQKEIAQRDVTRADTDGWIKYGQGKLAAEQALFTGEEARRTAKWESMSAIASGLYSYHTTKV